MTRMSFLEILFPISQNNFDDADFMIITQLDDKNVIFVNVISYLAKQLY